MALHLHGLVPWLYEMRHTFAPWNLPRGIWLYWRSYLRYRRGQSVAPGFPLRLHLSYPQYFDAFAPAGHVLRHYFHQDLWAARKVRDSGVPVHHDIGSRLDGFIGHCLVFCRVVMIDVRPLPLAVPNLAYHQADACHLEGIPADSVPSLSSLHALEHFGLGRYGDPVDAGAYLQAAREMIRVLAPGGNLYLSVPIGQQRLEFNAHRVFDPLHVLALFDALELVEFSVVDDADQVRERVEPRTYRDSRYACGLFWFRKPLAGTDRAAGPGRSPPPSKDRS